MTGAVGDVWKRTGMYIAPDSSREVMSVLGSIGVFSTGQRFAWRGMSSADYDLRSSLHRRLGPKTGEGAMRGAEIKLLSDARSWGLGIRETGHIDDLQLLTDLQHYGIPTRLIDFTNNPMTALWFACQTPGNTAVTRSGLLLALDVAKWPSFASVGSSKGKWGSVGNPNGFTLENALKSDQPFLVESSTPNDRLRAQEGFFAAGATPRGGSLERVRRGPFVSLDVAAAHGDPNELKKMLLDERGRGAPGALPYVAVLIKSSLKGKLLRYLENTYNRRPRVLFPDYAGFKDYGSSSKRGGDL